MENEKFKIENVKIMVDILRFKTMLFTGVLGSGIYLILNTNSLKEYVNNYFLFITIMCLFFYGLYGFFFNLVELNRLLKKLKELNE